MTFVYGHNRIRWNMHALYTIVFLLFSYSCELQNFWSTFVYAGTYMLTYGKNASYWRIRLAYTNLCVWNTYHGVYELFGITLRFHLLQRWQHEIRFVCQRFILFYFSVWLKFILNGCRLWMSIKWLPFCIINSFNALYFKTPTRHYFQQNGIHPFTTENIFWWCLLKKGAVYSQSGGSTCNLLLVRNE